MLKAVRILKISYINLLELINGQALFRYWVYVFYLSDQFVKGVIPLQLLNCNLTLEFLSVLMLRVVNHIGGYTFKLRCTWGSYSLMFFSQL